MLRNDDGDDSDDDDCDGDNDIFLINGDWFGQLPVCIRVTLYVF